MRSDPPQTAAAQRQPDNYGNLSVLLGAAALLAQELWRPIGRGATFIEVPAGTTEWSIPVPTEIFWRDEPAALLQLESPYERVSLEQLPIGVNFGSDYDGRYNLWYAYGPKANRVAWWLKRR